MMRATPVFPPSPGVLVEWLRGLHRSSSDFIFGVRRLEDDAFLGFVHLDGILWTHGVCGLAYLIGNPEHRGRGYGYEAADLALAYAFQELNLHRVTVTTYAYNRASRAVAEKLGFQREGAFREFINRDGQRYDMELYGILRPEWETRRAAG
jgi:RimJ/RimL family protein N-acetyltransferase